jgi:biotin operon repressor/nucleotide-binding universal stress UspA family protein
MPNTTNTNTAALSSFTSTRKFGVEIELVGLTMSQAAAALMGAGIEAYHEDTNHTTRAYWKVVYDGSVDGGCEVVSPVLSGVEGLEQVRNVARVLVAAGATVNRQCGLHVHVDAGDLSGQEIINAARRYEQNERKIDALMPRSRRDSNSSYCTSMARIVPNLSRFTDTASPTSVCQGFGRYYKLNLAAYLVHGTLEFRQHAGTVNGEKIVNWIVFCVQFIEDSRIAPAPAPVVVPVVAAPVATVAVRRNAVSTKMEKLRAMFARAGQYMILSGSEIARELDIAEASVPAYITMFRAGNTHLTIQSRRNRGYYCSTPLTSSAPVAAPAARPAPRSVDIFANLPVAVRSYFAERELDLTV